MSETTKSERTETPRPMSVCEVRLKAAEIIEQLGWHNAGGFWDGKCYCLVGTLAVATGGKFTNVMIPNPKLLDAALVSMGFAPWSADPEDDGRPWAPEWNDAPERTKEEVLARLREGCEAKS